MWAWMQETKLEYPMHLRRQLGLVETENKSCSLLGKHVLQTSLHVALNTDRHLRRLAFGSAGLSGFGDRIPPQSSKRQNNSIQLVLCAGKMTGAKDRLCRKFQTLANATPPLATKLRCDIAGCNTVIPCLSAEDISGSSGATTWALLGLEAPVAHPLSASCLRNASAALKTLTNIS